MPVLNLPFHIPGFAAVIGTFPVSVDFVGLDVVPDHALFAGITAYDGITGQNHLSIMEVARKVQVDAVVAGTTGCVPRPRLRR